ncbi:MAG: App1 family protein [Bacteroidota bacterium]|nr:App1 family protein [Bacteroidota bacterium]
MRLTRSPVVKVYHGYGNKQHVIVFGHVLKLSPLPRKKYRSNFITNSFALLRSFMVRPWAGAILQLIWNDETFETKSEYDGFYRFEWFPGVSVNTGWLPLQVHLLNPATGDILATGEGLVFIPHTYQYAIISDIDDTFLISHSSNLRKRLYVLFTKNAHSRKSFAGVVRHYQLLATAAALENLPNPFFYVSSSEWNLYDFIYEFSRKNELPKGIFLLSQLKLFKEILNTGQNRHATKFMRIVRIIEAYPEQRFILLGDDSQEDPNIYASVVKHFPGKIHAVYLRHVYKSNQANVKNKIQEMEKAAVLCCYFSHSEEAIKHSMEMGLIASI